MAGYQSFTIVGNVGRDVVMRYTPNGIAVADFSVAVTRKFGSEENRTEETLWVRVTCWRKLAEIANQYVRKGQQVLVVGTIKISTYLDKQGQPAASLELTADTFQLLGKKSDNENGDDQRAPAYAGEPSSDLSDIPF